jgi:hypothetical protein
MGVPKRIPKDKIVALYPIRRPTSDNGPKRIVGLAIWLEKMLLAALKEVEVQRVMGMSCKNAGREHRESIPVEDRANHKSAYPSDVWPYVGHEYCNKRGRDNYIDSAC